ncbi:hypothetical protein MHBO_003255 [Bonamia ostreae]|uniref:RGS domain-containing protein n=1 Tax=Bonamia ostreae TaxID=126728 RepID=A0ABV2APW9_9EUKA
MYDNDVHHKQSRKRHKNQLECPNPNLIANLKPFTSCHYIEQRLNSEGKMNFDYMMSEPLGRHMLKSFFASVFSISKVIFMSDVKLFQRIRAESARRKVAEMILERFVLPADDREIEESVFAHDKFYVFLQFLTIFANQ